MALNLRIEALLNTLKEREAMKNSKGFTLLEVIIVIGVIGIMTAIAAPSISNWLPNYRLKGAARDLYGAAMRAKGEAVKRRVNCALTFNQTIGGTKNAYVVYADTNANFKFDAGDNIILQVQQLPPKVGLDLTKYGGDGLSFVNNGDGNPTIAFRPNAIPTSSTGGLANGTAALINTKGRSQNVVINQAGNIRITD